MHRLQKLLKEAQSKIKELEDKCNKFKNINSYQQQQIINFKKDKNMEEQLFNIKFQQKLSGIFTSTQINLILNKKKAYKWSDEDISSAISLRSISPKGYRYLREKKKYPLPGIYV